MRRFFNIPFSISFVCSVSSFRRERDHPSDKDEHRALIDVCKPPALWLKVRHRGVTQASAESYFSKHAPVNLGTYFEKLDSGMDFCIKSAPRIVSVSIRPSRYHQDGTEPVRRDSFCRGTSPLQTTLPIWTTNLDSKIHMEHFLACLIRPKNTR